MKHKMSLIKVALFCLLLSGCSFVSHLESSSLEESPTNESSEVTSSQGNESTSEEENESQISSEDTSVRVSGVSLNYDEVSITKGKNLTLIASVEPNDATNKNLSWRSSNENVANVSSNGTVNGLTVGETTITVTTEDGGFTASCLVHVVESEEEEYVPEESEDILAITAEDLEGMTPTEKEEYEFTLDKNYKQVYINTPDKKIVLNLNGKTIQNDSNSPIFVADCDSIDISATKNKTSYIIDDRPIYTADEDGQGKGAIYVDNGDLTLKGKGVLEITANYLNGIHGKDDVDIKNLTLSVTAVNHAIRGNDSITAESGTITVNCGGDGFHTENSDLSSKGNQRGNITVNDATITVNSWSDAFDASYNVIIDGEAEITAKTNKQSSYTGEIVETTESSFYIKMSSSVYANGGYTYAAYINGEFYKATYKGTISGQSGGGPGGGGPGGGSSTFYVYEISRPTEAVSFKLYRYSGNVSTFSTTNYNAASESKSFNSYYDMISISRISGSTISLGNWSSYSSNGISSKGLKADNEVIVNNGTISIDSVDDAIHANNDVSLENGETPLGNVTIAGGELTLATSDDGLHADGIMNISGGTINITSSYEGIEGNVINISGGTTYVFATDDGVNASSGKSAAAINITGGYLDVTVNSNGDTDGIDSNGTYTQSGGVVIVKGPGRASSTNFGAAALDTDGTVRLTGGTLIVFGGIEQTPSYTTTKTLCSSSTVSTGNHTITFTSNAYTTNLKYSTNGCVVYSELGNASLS